MTVRTIWHNDKFALIMSILDKISNIYRNFKFKVQVYIKDILVCVPFTVQYRVNKWNNNVISNQRDRRIHHFKKWNDANYSWDGLQNKNIVVSNSNRNKFEISLQDYWSIEEDKLILGEDGKYYTRFHLPFEFFIKEDGKAGSLIPSQKTKWSEDKWEELERDLKQLVVQQVINFPKRRNFEHKGGLYICDGDPKKSFTTHSISSLPDLSGVSLRTIPQEFAHSGSKLKNASFDNLKWEMHGSGNSSEVEFTDCLFKNNFDLIDFFLSAPFSIISSEIHGCLTISNMKANDSGSFKMKGCLLNRFKISNSVLPDFSLGTRISRGYQCSFENADFTKTADFRGAGLSFLGAIDGARFDGKLLLDSYIRFSIGDEWFKREMAFPSCLEPLVHIIVVGGGNKASHRAQKAEYFHRIIGGAQVIKNKMQADGFDERAHRFYRMELWARNLNPYTELGQRTLLTLYRISSSYGYSVVMPVCWIFLLSFLLSLVYLACYTWSTGWSFNPGGISFEAFNYWPDAVSFSIGRIAPIIPWDAKVASSDRSLDFILRNSHGFPGATIHLVAVLQTIVCTALFFLSGLAARRRFKMTD